MVNPIPNFAKNVWSKWNIRGVILTSLFLQIVLIFLAPLRKRTRKLVMLLWPAYLLADYTANFCVGLISNKYGDEDTPISNINDFLIAFWTPFLLLHLGGPDTITAFSLEDNELWLRHMLGLIFQVYLTGYVFLLTLPANTLWLPTALVFLAGIIKFAERTRSLQLASVSNFRQSMIHKPVPGPNYAKLMEEFKTRKEAGLPTKIEKMPEISDQTTGINEKSAEEAEEIRSKAELKSPNYAKLMEEFNSRKEAGLPTKIEKMPEISDQTTGINEKSAEEAEEIRSKAELKSPNYAKLMEEFNSRKEAGPPTKIEKMPEISDQTTGINEKSAEEIHLIVEPTPTNQTPKEVTNHKGQELSNVEAVRDAYHNFVTFKGLVVDMIFSFRERNNSRDYFLKLTALDALRVIEVELNFFYEAFYTKASVLFNWFGFLCRFGSVCSVVAALILFVYDEKRGCDEFDVKVTYTLLYGAVGLDVVSLLMLLFSDHSFASVKSLDSEKNDFFSLAIRAFRDFFVECFLSFKSPIWKTKVIKSPTWLQNGQIVLGRSLLCRRWFESIAGFNLIPYCLCKRENWLLDHVIDYIGATELVEQWIYEIKQPVLQELWIFIYTELERKSADADDVETIQRICSSRGEWVIQEGELSRADIDKLMPYVERNNVTFDQCLMLWHIATDLLFYDVQGSDENVLEKDGQDIEQRSDKMFIKMMIKMLSMVMVMKKMVKMLSKGVIKMFRGEGGQDIEQGSTKNDGQNVEQGRGNVNEKDFSKLLSDYMLYLLIMQPTMMSAVRGIGQIRFQDTCAEATNFFSKRQMSMADGGKDKRKKLHESIKKCIRRVNQFSKDGKKENKEEEDGKKKNKEEEDGKKKNKEEEDGKKKNKEEEDGKEKNKEEEDGKKKEKEEKDGKKKNKEEEACKKLIDVCLEQEPSAVKGDRSKSLLFDACMLADKLKQLKGVNKWKVIAQVWVELLSYAACNCIPITHVQQLSKGGEFISLVWLLMTHLGLAKQFQIKEGHARAKLIVGETTDQN